MPRPDLPSVHSGFWATVPVAAEPRPGPINIGLEVALEGGGAATVTVATLEVVDPAAPLVGAEAAVGPGTIAICMAAFEPPPELLRIQLDSIRAQTDENWLCLISDDCSSPEGFAAIADAVGGDERFVVSRSERRLGFYRNFERALQMVPAGVDLVALSDQDDRWYPDKLATLRAALGDAELVYSDMRLVAAGGAVLGETLWEGRDNNHTNLASLLIANTVAGAASLFRRRLLELALPFPHGPGWDFHDHWLGLAGLVSGTVNYVDRPLYDYVQHAGAILGQVAVDGGESSVGGGRRPALRGVLARWRAAYFRVYLQHQLLARVLLARGGDGIAPAKRRVLERFVAAERSPAAFAWLALRPLRRLVGRNETLGNESQLARGILWRHALALRTRRHERPTETPYDASFPSCGPESFGERQLGRWRARPSS
jgi:glycosyltransferase involved in cell wall biosynthesis